MVTCPNCGSPVPKDAQFCLSCGEPMGAPLSEPEKIVEDVSKKAHVKKVEKKTAEPAKKKVEPQLEKKIEKPVPPPTKAASPLDEEDKKRIKTIKEEYAETESPHVVKKAPSPLLPAILVLVVLVALAAVYTLMNPSQCNENWQCDSWTNCTDGVQYRWCVDQNKCGSSNSKPQAERECEVEIIEPNETVELPPEPVCVKQGQSCVTTADCCNGTCVHSMCWNETTYCGDGYCEGNETCSTCPYDCGECTSERDLVQNVYTDPLPYLTAQSYDEEGYVIIRYFYSPACDACFEPVNIEDQLRELAAGFKDLLVMEIIDTQQNLNHASRYAKVGTTIYKPLIRVGAEHPYDVLYGTGLGDKLQDGDIIVDVADLLCKHSDYCEFKDNKIVRT